MRVKASNAFRSNDTIRITGDSVAGAWTADLSLRVNSQSPGVAALWARARIADLLDKERRGADAAETRAAIVATALKHHLVSKFTSLVAVDKTPVRPAGTDLDSEQVANLMPHGQSGAAVFGFPATATNAAVLRTRGLALLMAGLVLLSVLSLQRRVTRGVVA